MKIDPSKINSLTELEVSGWKLVNTNLSDLYNGLHPDSICKLAHVIFNCFLYNKKYIRKDDKRYNEGEAKRIFTNMLFQPIDIANRINSLKYADGSSKDNDISNILKRLDELEENNVFYIWKFKQPFTYIYIIERDVSSWKYYNSNGFLLPRCIKKIAKLANNMIDTMEHLEKQRNRISNRKEIEESFGEFLNKLIDKMNPTISILLPRWDGKVNIFTYISDLVGEIKKLNDKDEIKYDDSFINRLPEHIRRKVIKLHKGENMESMELIELIPKNANIIKPPRIKRDNIKTKKVENNPTLLVETLEFQSTEPFKNPTEFTKYYRSFLRLYNGSTKFYDFVSEILYAAKAMDLITLNGRYNNKRFLDSWLRFYIGNSLVGNNVYREDKTSISNFIKTFEVYNSKYIG